MTVFVNPAQKTAEQDNNHAGWFVTWANMPNGSQGNPGTFLVGFADHSFQIEGTFGAGGTVAIVGSNDGVNYRVLNDVFGNPLNNIVSPCVKQVLESAAFVVPAVTAGDGTTAINVTALFRRSKVHD